MLAEELALLLLVPSCSLGQLGAAQKYEKYVTEDRNKIHAKLIETQIKARV